MPVSLSLGLLYIFQLVISGGQLLRPLVLFYRGSVLYNELDGNMRMETNIVNFKQQLKLWVIENIAIKPKSQFANISQRIPNGDAYSAVQLNTTQPDVPQPRVQNTIIRYFRPI